MRGYFNHIHCRIEVKRRVGIRLNLIEKIWCVYDELRSWDSETWFEAIVVIIIGLLILLSLLGFLFGRGTIGGYGRYNADMYDTYYEE